MSRSWIERARRRLAPAASAGVAIGRDYVGYAYLEGGRSAWRMRTLTEVRLDTPLFSGAPTAQLGAALARALQESAGNLTRRYLPVHVSLPDAMVRWAMFELDELPKSRAAQLDLVRFRFERQGLNGAHVYACQALARAGDKPLLLGTAADGAWLRLVSDALTQAGIVAWSLGANVCRQFNLFHDRLAQASGVLVALAPDAWSLWLWDEQGFPRYARARWRTEADDHAEVALAVERAILAYVHGAPGRTVARVFTAAGDETGAMAGALDARLREPCTRLSSGDFDLGADAAHGKASAALSLAAALER